MADRNGSPVSRKKILIGLALVGAVGLGLYGFYLNQALRYSHGRKGIDAKVRTTLTGLLPVARADRQALPNALAAAFRGADEWSAFDLRMAESVGDCLNLAQSCIVATSAMTYRGKADIYVLDLSSGQINEVQRAGPKSFSEWILQK